MENAVGYRNSSRLQSNRLMYSSWLLFQDGVATVFFVKEHFHAVIVPQWVRFLIMVLRITNNFRMHAVIATL